MLSRLGLPQDTLIKIRRQSTTGSKTKTNLNTSSGPETDRQRSERLWATMQDLRRASISHCATGAVVHGDRDVSAKNDHIDIFPVTAAEVIKAGDVLCLSCAKASDTILWAHDGPLLMFRYCGRHKKSYRILSYRVCVVAAHSGFYALHSQAAMVEFQAVMVSQGLKGLRFLNLSAAELPGHGTEFFEVILSAHNHFVGRTADWDNFEFSRHYDGCSVVAVRRRGKVDATNPVAVAASLSVSRDAMNITKHSTLRSVHSSGARTMDSKSRVMTFPEHTSDDIMEQGVLSPTPSFEPTSGTEVSSSGSDETVPTSVLSDTPLPMDKSRPRVPPYILPPLAVPSRDEEGEEENVTESLFQAGNMVLVLAKKNFMEKHGAKKDFLLVARVGSVPKPAKTYDYVPLLVFLGMLVWVLLGADMVRKRPRDPENSLKRLQCTCGTAGHVPGTRTRDTDSRTATCVSTRPSCNRSHIQATTPLGLSGKCFVFVLDVVPCREFIQVQAAFAAGGVMILGGWVDAKNAVGCINWRLLLLIGSALGLSKGVVNSGRANYVGVAIRNSGMSPDGSLFVICAFTMVSQPVIGPKPNLAELSCGSVRRVPPFLYDICLCGTPEVSASAGFIGAGRRARMTHLGAIVI